MSKTRKNTRKATNKERVSVLDKETIEEYNENDFELINNPLSSNTLVGVSGKQERIDGDEESIGRKSIDSDENSEEQDKEDKGKGAHVIDKASDHDSKAWERKLDEFLREIDKRVSRLESSNKRKEKSEQD